MEGEKTKKRCISFGKCNSKYCYLIVGVILINLLTLVILFSSLIYFIKNNIIYSNLINLLSYSFLISLGESFMIIPDLILTKSISSKKEELSIDKNSHNPITYIFNEYSVDFSLKEKVYLILAAFLKLFLELFFISYQYFIEKDYNFIKTLTYSFQFELIFLFLLSKKMYNIQFYKHQNFSIIILTISGFINFTVKYMEISIGNFFLFLFIHLFYSFLKSMITVYIKGLMEYKYISPYKACYIFGMINLIIVTIIYLIVSFVPCDNVLCQVEYNGQHYLGNILGIINISGLFILLFLIIKAILLVFNYIIIHDFSVCHSFLLIQFSQILENSSMVGLNLDNDNLKFFIILIFFCINIFFILLFLEIVEINICKISYNSKKNIQKRALIDKELSVSDYEDNNDDEEIEEDN